MHRVRKSTPRVTVARSPRAAGRRIALVASQFNRPITMGLVRGALDVLRRAGVARSRIELWWVPGAFELPAAAARLARRRARPDAIIALGTLIRGQTIQYEVLAHAVAEGLMQVAVSDGLPVTCGVIVASTAAQAKARAGATGRNRGAEAALAALAVLDLFDRWT